MRECDYSSYFPKGQCQTTIISYYKPFKAYAFTRLGEFPQKNSYTIKIKKKSSKDSMEIKFNVNWIKDSFGGFNFDTIQYQPGIYVLTPLTDEDLESNKRIDFKDRIKVQK
jgi:hypothetical protein